MVSRRALLQALGLSVTAGLTGCNALDTDDENKSATLTRTATGTPTVTPSTTLPPTTVERSTTSTVSPTASETPTPTPTVVEDVGTPALTSALDSEVDEFGRAVALSADAAVVVPDGHGASVFENDGQWNQTTVLTPEGDEDFGGYNVSVAMNGEEAIIGGPGAGAQSGTGAVYLFERVDDEWRQQQQFTSDEDTDEFGRAIAFDGDHLVVGDANDPTPEVSWIGRAYVFERDGTNWTQEAILRMDAQNLFGTSVAVDGDTILIGAPYAEPGDDRIGAVYAYELTDGEWQRRTTLTPDDPADDTLFGQSFAIDADTAVIGAPGSGTGSAYVFERTHDGWARRARITAPDEDPRDDFGRSVASTGGITVVGAPKTARNGHAYVFRSDDNWTETRRLVAADPHEDAEFGFAVALFDTTALVGAPVFRAASPAYLFDL